MIDRAAPAVAVQGPAASSSCSVATNSVVIVSHRILERHLLVQADHHSVERRLRWIEHCSLIKALMLRHHVLLSCRGGLQVVALEAQAHHLIAGVC